jgi:hypothetical protein
MSSERIAGDALARARSNWRTARRARYFCLMLFIAGSLMLVLLG